MRRAGHFFTACALVVVLGAGCSAILGIPSEVDRADSDGGGDAPFIPTEASGDAVVPGSEAGVDAADAGDAADAEVIPTGPLCDPTKDFLAPALLTSISKDGTEGSARLSDDEKTMYFAAQPAGSATYGLFAATRTVLTDSFQGMALIAGDVNSASNHEYQPNLTTDGLTLFFERQDSITEDSDIWMASRATLAAPFGTAMPVPGTVNGAARYDAKVFVRGDGSQFFFSSILSGSHAHILVADKTGATWTTTPVAGVGSVSYDEYSPVITKDGLTMYFASQRPTPDGSLVGYNIWVAKRTAVGLAFDEPTLVPAVNSAGFEEPNWVSLDGCRLYLNSNRQAVATRQAIYVAKRPF